MNEATARQERGQQTQGNMLYQKGFDLRRFLIKLFLSFHLEFFGRPAAEPLARLGNSCSSAVRLEGSRPGKLRQGKQGLCRRGQGLLWDPEALVGSVTHASAMGATLPPLYVTVGTSVFLESMLY